MCHQFLLSSKSYSLSTLSSDIIFFLKIVIFEVTYHNSVPSDECVLFVLYPVI